MFNSYMKQKKNNDYREQPSLIIADGLRSPYDEAKLSNNTFIIGDKGDGAYSCYVKPNILQCDTDLFVVDPTGDILSEVGPELLQSGYIVRPIQLGRHMLDLDVFNSPFADMETAIYNPFQYIKTDNDIIRMAEIFASANKYDNYTSICVKRHILSILIAYIILMEPVEQHSLLRLQELINDELALLGSVPFSSDLRLKLDKFAKICPQSIGARLYKSSELDLERSILSCSVFELQQLFSFANMKDEYGDPVFSSFDTVDVVNSVKQEKTAIFLICQGQEILPELNCAHSLIIEQVIQTMLEVKRIRPAHFIIPNFLDFKLLHIDKLLILAKENNAFLSLITPKIQPYQYAQVSEIFEYFGNILYFSKFDKTMCEYVFDLSARVDKQDLYKFQYLADAECIVSYQFKFPVVAHKYIMPQKYSD